MPKNNKTKNPMQKGRRRQKLHEEQNNIGNPQNIGDYADFEGNLIK